jgi:RNA polymerase sigma factor (sigma-70 family)
MLEPSAWLGRQQHVEQATKGGISVAQTEPASEGGSPRPHAGRIEVGAMALQSHASVEHLYRTQRLAMLRLARLLTDSAAVAEEIVQEAFIRFARSAGQKDEPAAYLRVIVVNLCRSQQRRSIVERRFAPRTAPPLSGLPEIDETWDLVRALPFRQRAVLMLRYYEDLSEADIARVLGCRPGTVKSALHRGLAALRKELGDRAEDPQGGRRNV